MATQAVESRALGGLMDAQSEALASFSTFTEAFVPKLKGLGEKIQQAEETIQGLNSAIENKDKRILELEALLKKERDSLAEKTKECADLEAAGKKKDERLDSLSAELEKRQKRVDELKEQNEIGEQRLVELRKNLVMANTKNEQSAETIKKLNEKVAVLTKVKESYKLLNTQLDHLCHKFNPACSVEKESGDKKIEMLKGLVNGAKAELVDVFDIYGSYSKKIKQIKQDNEKLLDGGKQAGKAENDPLQQTSKTLAAEPLKVVIKDLMAVKKAFTNELSNLLIEVKILEDQNRDLSEYKRINELLKQINYQKLQDMIEDFKSSNEVSGDLTEKQVKTMAKKNTATISTAINLDSDLETITGIFKEMMMANTKHLLLIKQLEAKLREYGHPEDCDIPVELTESEAVTMQYSYLASSGVGASKLGMMSMLDSKVDE